MSRRRTFVRRSRLMVVAIALGVPSVCGGAEIEPGSVAHEVPRLALVVGAQDYETLDDVPNAFNDANEIARALGNAGFTVRFLRDPETADAIYDQLNALSQQIRTPDDPAVLVFYFAGHGFQRGENNYLVPTRAPKDEAQLLDASVPVTSVFGKQHPGLDILLLDACRTSVSPGQPTPPLLTAATGPGFAAIREPRVGAIVGMAAHYGKPAFSAAHVGDPTSPYSTGLLLQLRLPGVSPDDVLNGAARYVYITTGHRQSPVFVKIAPTTATYFRFMKTTDDTYLESRRWELTRESNRSDCGEAYIFDFPDSRYLLAAQQWIDRGGLAPGNGGVGCPEN